MVFFGLTTNDEMMLGYIQYTLEDLSIGVEEKAEQPIKITAYPNPYSTSTTIRYLLENPGNVKIELFNVLGNKISTLLNENQLQGDHQYQFTASDHNLSAGFYQVHLAVNGVVSTLKLVEVN